MVTLVATPIEAPSGLYVTFAALLKAPLAWNLFLGRQILPILWHIPGAR